ncbi:MAG: long-chain fatty acid--CoA ligase [Hyphomicrobiaceae bacterium]|nr:MAG: long-chain fatty acid--CoA ligase [Hyphomicrobiaceae bacterium]
MNLSLTLQNIARHLPDRPAISSEGSRLAYGAFEHQVQHMAGGLAERHGLKPGARVALVMENCPELLPALYAIWRAGLAAVPINSKLHAREMAWIMADAEVKLCLATPKLADGLSAPGVATGTLPPIVATGSADYAGLFKSAPVSTVPGDAEAEAWIFYTSGTTGRPKGALLTHRNLLFACHCYYADIDYIGPDDTILHAAPLTHGSGLYGLAHIARGSHNVILPGSFEPEHVLDALVAYANVSMFAAPTMVSRLINHPRAGSADTRGLKTIIYGGAPMYVADLKRALSLLGPKLYQLYGQGESPMTITGLDKALHADAGHPRYEERLGSAGLARTGVAVKVVNEAGRELPAGEVGEIVTRSDCVMKGYWNNPAANAQALRQGWLWTGDLGSMDGEGFLTLKDRSKDLIISGGANIYPREVEEVLLTHPAVLEAAVVSRPHADWGEEVIAYVVKRAGTDTSSEELDRLCLDNIARFKRPKGYRFVEALPKNNYGKILKTELRAQLKLEGQR